MAGAVVSRGTRRFVLVSVGFFVVWHLGVVAGIPRRTEVFLGLYGFVFHMVFGKAYGLVPAYFDRTLAFPRAPRLQLPATALGTVGLALGSMPGGPALASPLGAVLWVGGIGIFVVTLGVSVSDNPTGRETGTGDVNRDRRRIDRLANAFVPIAGGYLALGSFETLAYYSAVPSIVGGYFPRTTHLLAAGTATLLVFALGFRLLPRFLVVHPPPRVVGAVLVAGALGPGAIALGLPSGGLLHLGAVLETIALVGFAAAVVWLIARSDRRRVGFVAVGSGAGFGALAVGLGAWMAFTTPTAATIVAHYRLNLVGFLGLTIVGIAYQFYPPAAGSFPGAADRTAAASIVLIAGGLGLEAVGHLAGVGGMIGGGRGLIAIGSLVYAYLIARLFVERYDRL